MEGCLLCLEANNAFMGAIKVNSTEWQDLDIKNLIDKHLFPLQSIQISSWLCATCWEELHDFHIFYVRIEEAQRKTESEEIKIELSIDTNLEAEIQTQDILTTELNLEDQKLLIKEENGEDLLDEDDMPLIKLGKRKRQATTNAEITIVEDPLSKTKKIKHSKSSKVKTKNFPKRRAKAKKETSIETATIEEEYPIKSDPDSIDNDAFINNSDTDSNYEPDKIENSLTNESKTHNKNSKTNNLENDKFIADNFKIICILCQIPMETFQALCKHFKVEHKQQGYVMCCNKKFYRRSLLVDHVHQHLDPNYFKCSDCGKVAADRICLRLHSKIHESKREKNHCCDICGKGFVNRKVLYIHKAIHLSEEEKHFPCSECGKNFGNKWQVSNHVRAVHLNKNAKICDICGRSIRCKQVFERHMLEHEGKPLPSVSCDVCGLLLANKHGLKRHKEMIHPVGGKQEYTCSICSKISPNLKAHKKHVQYKHELGYNHKCTICDKAYKTAQTLNEHMATHTGTVLYTCPWCPKTFNSNANMHSHRKKMHPKEWEEETRKKYSGKLPPNYKPPLTNKVNVDYTIPLYTQ